MSKVFCLKIYYNIFILLLLLLLFGKIYFKIDLTSNIKTKINEQKIILNSGILYLYAVLLCLTVPPQTFDFNYTEVSKGDRELECHAKGVYPRPLLTLSEQTASSSNFHVIPKVNVTTHQNSGTNGTTHLFHALFDCQLYFTC